MKSFIISTKGIAFENFEDEVVVVNLPVGYYYSMKGSARNMFLHIVNGSNQDSLSKFIVNNYNIDLEEAIYASEIFIKKLEDHKLLEEIIISDAIEEPSPANKTLFDPPIIEIYDDMKELLSLDPIHDVDSVQGWPLKK